MMFEMNRLLPARRFQLNRFLLCAAFAAILVGCGQRPNRVPAARATPSPTTRHPATQPAGAVDVRSLFDRLGGAPAVTKVVDDFVAVAAADPKVNFARKGQPEPWDAKPEQVALLKKRLVEFVSAATGGDAHYNGQDMVTAHRGMNVTDAEFDALASDLKAALEKNSVPVREQAELLAVVNRTRSAIVATSTTSEKSGSSPARSAEAPKPAAFVPQPVTSNETELEPEQPAPPEQLNK
jgi:hemoglobin